MALALQQVMRQSQRLIMTPQMQQSIQLLQMNAIELEQLTQEELLENPFLQVEEDRSDGDSEQPTAETPEGFEGGKEATPAEPEPGADAEPDMFSSIEREVEQTAKVEPAAGTSSDIAGESSAPAEAQASAEAAPSAPESPTDTAAEAAPAETAEEATPSLEELPEHFKEVDLNWDDYYDGSENKTHTREPAEEQTDFSEYTAAKMSLYEELTRQLRLCSLEGRDAQIGEYLIGSLDDDGYLGRDVIEETAAKFEVEIADIERVLVILQEFDPIGIAARTPSECLLLQMKALGNYSELAREVLEEHFEQLQRKKFKEIARAVKADEKQIIDIFHKVGRLEPKPGRRYSREPIQYITPDVHVKDIEGELTYYLNERSSGHLSVNRLYRRLLRLQEQAFTKEEKNYALDKFRNALMLIKNIEKRKSTILRVTEAIMDVQRAFLDKGVSALKPLTLREVADMVGMHESTIARVTSRKYVETPQGLYSLKFFFSSGIESTNGTGGAVSSRSIKDRLLAMIDEEDTKKPLSDQKISEMLKTEGHHIARRTVAKYRDQLKILPAKLRREA